jgi:muramoyltetrapeptide carboxypeptidase
MPVQKIQPPYLQQGDSVAIISPSFCIESDQLGRAVDFLKGWGLNTRIGRNASKRNGPFAGTDEERLADLQEMTDDPSVKAVFCSRGGYGMSRIIDKVNFSSLTNNPKWYSGFSDITVLHMWLNEICGIMSVHGEMPLNFHNSEKSTETFSTLKSALFGLPLSYQWTGKFYNVREVTGEVTGGNLSLLYSLTGTRAEISPAGKILFIEDVKEYYYHIDRMLTSMKLSGKLENLTALIIGGMNKIEDAKIPWGRDIEETIFSIVGEYDYPVFFNFPSGHISDNRAFYIGKQARISVSNDVASLEYD